MSARPTTAKPRGQNETLSRKAKLNAERDAKITSALATERLW